MKKAWEHFGSHTLGEYYFGEQYLNVDFMLFLKTSDIYIKTYSLNPVHYYAVPSSSFDCILKYTEKNLQLLTNYDLLLMFEKVLKVN